MLSTDAGASHVLVIHNTREAVDISAASPLLSEHHHAPASQSAEHYAIAVPCQGH
jgi:hypothetical protein